MQIYDKDNDPILDMAVDDNSYRYKELMGDNTLSLMFSMAEFIELPVGCRCEFKGESYFLFLPENFKKNHTRSWDYTLVMYSHQKMLSTTKFKFFTMNGCVVEGRFKLKFSLTATPAEFAQLLVDNMNINDPDGGWTLGVCIEASPVTLDFNHEYCDAALSKMAAAFNTEYDVTVKTISIGPVEKMKDSPIDLEYGYDKGILGGIQRTQYDDSKIITRVYVQGGSDNIDASLYGNDTLLLPKSTQFAKDGVVYASDPSGSYVERANRSGSILDDSLDVSDVKPRWTGTVSSVVAVDDSKSLYDILDNSIPEELDFAASVIEGETMSIIFQSGDLAGKEFDVAYDHNERRFAIVPVTENGYNFPQGALIPAVGDFYAVFHISLPIQYYQSAEAEVMVKTVDALSKGEKPQYTYKWTLDELYAKRNWLAIGGKLDVGYFVLYRDPQFLTVPVSIRIISVKDYVNKPKSPVIEISNNVSSRSFSSVLNTISTQEQVNERTNKEVVSFTRRRFRDAQETMGMLSDALTNFTGSISPISVHAMQIILGDESLQFYYVNSKVAPERVEDGIVYSDSTKRLSIPSGIIQHMTLGINSLSSSHAPSEYRFWDLAGYVSPLLDEANKKYYLYAKVSKTLNTGIYLLSETAIPMESVDGFFHLFVGTLGSELDGERSLVMWYGYSELGPGRFTTDKIVSPSGGTFIDLVNDVIKGNFKFVSGDDVEDVINGVSGIANTGIANAATAQAAANAAASAASAAQTTANTGVANAATANALLADLASDNKLTAIEKQQTKTEWDAIVSEKLKNDTQADAFGVAKTAYGTAYTALNTYITPLLADLTTTSDITGSTFRSTFKAYYDARTDLLNAISTKAKTLADAAQSSVNNIQIGGVNLLSAIPTNYETGSVLTASVVGTTWANVKYASVTRLNIISLLTINSQGVLSFNDSLYNIYLTYFDASGLYTGLSNGWITTSPFVFPTKSKLGITVAFKTNANILPTDIAAAKIKIERGNKATDFTTSPEDVAATQAAAQAAIQAQILETEYLKEAIGGDSTVAGGLALHNIMLVKDALENITGGMSGLSEDIVGMWMKGSYAQAIADAAKAFKAVMDTGVLDKKDGSGHRAFGNFAWNALGDVFMRGLVEVLSGGKIGDFTVESGQIIGRNSSGAEKIRMSTGVLPSISDLQSGTLYTGSFPMADKDVDISGESSAIYSGSDFLEITGAGFNIPYATTAQVTTGQYDAYNFTDPDAIITYEVIATAYVYKDGILYWSGPCDTNFSIAAGYFTVKIRLTLNYELQGPSTCIASYGMDDQSRGIQYTESVARSCFGANGFFSYWSSALYMYFSSTAGFTYRGALNFPGMLAAGSFNNAGTQDSTKRWGNKSSSSNATYTAVGQYRVYHGIGHANFTVNITCLAAGAVGTVVARATNYVDIVIQRNGANYQSAFDIMLVGAN